MNLGIDAIGNFFGNIFGDNQNVNIADNINVVNVNFAGGFNNNNNDIDGNVNIINNIGVQGPVGMPGNQGPIGVPGIQGLVGVQGVIGVPGIQGLVGVPGNQGQVGWPGIHGVFGATGAISAKEMKEMYERIAMQNEKIANTMANLVPNTESDSEELCSVCLDYLNESVHRTKCNHDFHVDCLRECLRDKLSTMRLECPLCRKNL